jgi:RHS repeat-associated protein
LVAPSYVAIGPDGSLYITDIRAGYIRRVGSDGVITTVVGNHECFTPTGCGDGGPALQAGIGNITSLAVGSDGSLYFIDVNRVRRVDPNGIITAFAGTGDYGFSGDGGPAITATFATAVGLAAAPDGSLYIGDPNNRRVRRVGPDGIITTFAGTGEPCTALLMLPDPCGDNGPAVQAKLTGPSSLAIGPDGSLYIADLSLRSVRRVSPNGIISTVAGTRNTGFSGDGGLATSALFSEIRGITVGRDGSLIIADSSPNLRVRYVGPDGMVKTIAGTGRSTGLFGGDNAPATQTNITAPFGVAVGLDGIVYFAEPNVNRIRRIGFNLPGFSVNDFSLASEDGSELYQFNSAGLHLRTLNALTGVLRYQFTYDGGNRLTTITDGDGNVTTIERNGSGDATAIIGPFSQRTALSLDSNGYLASIANPAGEVFRMAYTSDGLLTQFTDPRGNVSRVTYDPQGRLLQDTDAAGGFHHLARTDDDTTSTVTRTTALGRTTTYQVTKLPTGDKQQVVTFPDGAKNQLVSQTNATRTLTVRNGTVSTSQQGPDPRFGMQVPVLTSWTLTTPGRLTWNTTDTRTVSLSDPSNQLSLATQTDVVKLNNHTYTRTYDAASRTFTLTTPAGRQHTATIDLQGRPLRVAVPGLNPLQFAYDSRGRLISLTQDNRTYTFAYDSHSFLSLLTDPLTHTLSFIRDAVGRTTDITQPDGNHVLFTYDANGNMVSLTPPGRSTHTFGFTAVDLLQNYEPPTVPGNPTGAQLVYNLDRQLTQLVRAGTSINLSYDGAGRLLSISYPQDTVSGTYDAAGRLQTLTTASGSGLTYGYDGGVLLDTTWSGPVTGTIHRTIDNNFRLTSRTINGGNSQSFVYDDDGLLTQAGALVLQRSAQNGLVTGATLGVVRDTRSFNSFGEWTDYSATVGATMLFSTQYTRDLLGRITEQVETIESSTTTFTYTYDDVGRLIEVKHNGVATAAYTYDANGNRLRRTAGGAVDGVYDAQDRLTLYGATTYTYAASGELLSKTTGGQTTAYSYDVLGNLRGVTLPGGAQIQYLIDGRNRRTGKKVNGATVQGFLYQDRLRPIAELDGHNAVVSTFVYGSRANVPEYLVKGGTTYRIRTDHLGSPRLVVDTSTGAIVQRLDYDEFGNVLADTNPGFQPFGFAGGLYDQDTKLVRFGARDYDPETGRWTSKDVVGLARGLNLYVYANNDPVNFIDRTGKNPGAAAAGAAGVVGSAAAGGGAATTTGTVFGLGATSAFIARAGILGVPVAVGILIAAYLEDSAIEHADSIDDEGPNEGGAPDTVPDPTAPDSGVCGGPILPPALPENERPTIPVPQIIDPHDPAVPVDPEGPTIRPPKEDRPTEEPPYPGGPLIPDIPGPPKLPTF